MPRPRVEKVQITGYISENTSDLELVQFVRDQLKKSTSSVLVRQMAEVYQKYLNGQLIDAALLRSIRIDPADPGGQEQKKKNQVDLEEMQEVFREFQIQP